MENKIETVRPFAVNNPADGIIWFCEECHEYLSTLYIYCPHCGKKIEWSVAYETN